MQRSSSARPAQGHPIRRQFGAAPARSTESQAPARATRSGDDDLKLFALSFTAFFICIYTLIF